MNNEEKDEHYMALALDIAKKGLGYTTPNPMVGAVIVKDDKIISTGYHKRLGEAHAERNALYGGITPIDHDYKRIYKGATLYVNLEPCCHYGRTPPCTDAIIDAGISRVVIASKDIDSRVAGKSIKILNDAGISTTVGVLDKENKDLNSIYYFYKTYNRPYVVLKAAMTLDGKIATYTGDSKWISNDNCRVVVHKLRARLKSIAIGKNTIIHDKPSLNCRLDDTLMDKPVDKLVFSHDNDERLFASFAPNDGRNFFMNNDIVSSCNKFISFCCAHEIDSILVEGGSSVYTWFIENNMCDRIFLFYKPAILGNDGVPLSNTAGVQTISALKEWHINEIRQIDNNFMIDLSKEEPICLQV